jgi:hypothetical protein
MADQQIVPEDIDFNESDITRAAAKKTPRNGWYPFLVIDSKNAVAKSGHLMRTLTLNRLKDPTDAASKVGPAIRHNVIFPFTNKSVEGHKAPNTSGLCHAFFLALGEELPEYPRFSRDENSWVHDGAPIEKDEEPEIRREVTRKVFERGQEHWRDPGLMLNQMFYAELYQNGDYQNLRNIVPDLPEDAVLVNPDDFNLEPEEAEEDPASSSQGEEEPKGKAKGKKGKKAA